MITIEKPGNEDRSAWEMLYLAYADFYEYPVSAQTLDTVWSWIQDNGIAFFCLIARNEEGKLLGFAHYKSLLSPLRGQAIGFLDDLFVDPDHRGAGVVDALFAALRQECKNYGWPCMRWHTRADNHRARTVYDRYAVRTDWLTYQLDSAESA